MTQKTVLLALSGGVDSSLCAALLKEQGYDLQAVVMQMSDAHAPTVLAAEKAAQTLDIPLTVLDLREVFEREVVIPFINAYRQATTPNPCILCNPRVKFRYLLETADRLGCAYIATGHYARVDKADGRYFIKTAASGARDQSYMLYRLPQEVLCRLLLPLGEAFKDEVRQKARQLGLSSADAPDSQDNCFVPDGDWAGFIERRSGPMAPGDFISPEGAVCGRHRGLLHYTVGQRKGLGIALGRPVFVNRLNIENNTVELSYAGQEYRSFLLAEDCVFMCRESINEPLRALVKIRSAAVPAPALLTPLAPQRIRCDFDEPVRAPAPGQSAVFYLKDRVLGGGFIAEN